jgi:PBSX family phage terminase large subunit
MADIKLTKKQSIAWTQLTDSSTNEMLFGGSAGGGKSFIGCLWVATMCLQYDGVRFLIGRTVLTQLKLTTLNTLFETLQRMGLKSGEHYVYNGQSNVITFHNKSEIVLKDLQYNPSDANFDSLGGLELTGAFIDEAAQISNLAYNVIKSRIRFKLTEYNLIPKILMTANPSNTWIKKEFYLPFIQDKLQPNKSFIPSLPMDNPHLPPSYIEMLQTLPTQQRRRLLEGDWNYLDESDSVFNFDNITGCIFKQTPNPKETKYMSVDVARFGDDRTVICVWVGLVLVDLKTFSKLNTVEVSDNIKSLIQSHGIHPQNVIVDSDGVGGGVADQIRGKNFVNNSKPLHNENYVNLKTQCYIKLSELFKEGKISINLIEPTVVDDLTQELLSIKFKDIDKDNKISIMSKDEQKRILGKSPDLADALMMRMIYELKPKNSGRYALAQI